MEIPGLASTWKFASLIRIDLSTFTAAGKRDKTLAAKVRIVDNLRCPYYVITGSHEASESLNRGDQGYCLDHLFTTDFQILCGGCQHSAQATLASSTGSLRTITVFATGIISSTGKPAFAACSRIAA